MPPEKRRASPLAGLELAIQFLTVLPVRHSQASNTTQPEEPPDMAQALPWFPLVGALLGLALVDPGLGALDLLSAGHPCGGAAGLRRADNRDAAPRWLRGLLRCAAGHA